MDHQLQHALRQVQRRLREQRRWRLLNLVAIGVCLLAWLAYREASAGRLAAATLGWTLLLLLLISLAAVYITSVFSFRNLVDVARRVERQFPALHQALLAAITPQSLTADHRVGFLQSGLVRQVRRHALIYDWRQIVPRWRLFWLRAVGCLLLVAAAGITFRLFQLPARPVLAENTISNPQNLPAEIQVEPGDTEIERGTNLVVVARFTGSIPAQATLVVEAPSGPERRISMRRRLDDPLFTASAEQVDEDLKYRVLFGDQQSAEFQVRVFDYPDLVRADALIESPDYTGLEQQELLDTRRVTAVEGSRVSWTFEVNKPLETAALQSDNGESIPLEPDPENPLRYGTTITLQNDRQWKLQLRDSDGRENRLQHQLIAKVNRNQPAQLKALVAEDVRVSPLEELTVRASVEDDFGVRRYGISYGRPGEPQREVLLGQDGLSRQPHSLEYLLDFEALNAQPDQLLTYYFWAEDTDAQGKPRRSLSDQFFAEVRHFEEIFRQGQAAADDQAANQQQQGQGQSGGEEAAARLVELQRQIINATWNLIRREVSPEPSAALADDARLLVESQQSALESLSEYHSMTDDPESAVQLEEVRGFMEQAVQELSAATAPSREPLQPALQAEQASYQGLLRLQAHEHEVARSQSRSQTSSRSAASQRLRQQLQQLELDNDANRYETQRQAQSEPSQPQQQTERTLSQLRDLARRQQDINQQLQQQQVALQEQAQAEQSDEIERQLKRLRDQQEQLLRDADELQQELADNNTPRELQSTRQQLENSRQQLQQSAEALSAGDLAQALSEGTRAQRQLTEARQQLRQQSAERFAEDMRQMRQQARELDQRQQELTRQMEQTEEPGQPGLRTPTRDAAVSEQLTQQRDTLESLLDQMKSTIESAESSEPLLAESLYEGFREAGQRQIADNLQQTRELWNDGRREEATEQGNVVADDLQQLRRDVEQAAENILGNESVALRRAASELEDLARQLADELDRADSSQAAEPADPNGRPTSEPADNPAGESAAQTASDQQPTDSQQTRSPSADSPPNAQPSNENRDGQVAQSSATMPADESRDNANPARRNNGPAQTPRANTNDQRADSQSNPRRDGGGILQSLADSLGSGPITGDQFRQWSDRLRDVEGMLDDPELQAEAARIRDRARELRFDFKRRSQQPQWSLVRELVAQPLEELQREVAQELLRRSAQREALVPVDRDPVPEEFAERVRQYYEQLGQAP